MGQPIDEGSVRVPQWVRDLVSDAPVSLPVRGRTQPERDRAAERAARELRRIIYRAIDRFARSLEFEFSVPGRYPSGATFDDVLGYLAERGKDFTADSATMRRRVRSALMAEYEEADAIPLALEFRETAADAILATIVARFENRLRDVPISANKDSYTRRKVHQGLDSRVGIRTHRLLSAIEARGRVKVAGTTR